MWALCCDTKGYVTMGVWKQPTSSILTVRAIPADTAHSPNVGLMSSNVADVGLTLKQHWADFSLEWYLVISSVLILMLSKCTLQANVGLHLTVPHMPFSKLYESLTLKI